MERGRRLRARADVVRAPGAPRGSALRASGPVCQELAATAQGPSCLAHASAARGRRRATMPAAKTPRWSAGRRARRVMARAAPAQTSVRSLRHLMRRRGPGWRRLSALRPPRLSPRKRGPRAASACEGNLTKPRAEIPAARTMNHVTLRCPRAARASKGGGRHPSRLAALAPQDDG